MSEKEQDRPERIRERQGRMTRPQKAPARAGRKEVKKFGSRMQKKLGEIGA